MYDGYLDFRKKAFQNMLDPHHFYESSKHKDASYN